MARRSKAPRARPSARTPLPIRPTVAALAAALIAAALLVLGAETSSTALVAGAVALACALAWSLFSALLGRQLSAADQMSSPQPDNLARRALRALAARPVSIETVWVQLDQRGRMVGTHPGTGAPSGRGLYRAGASAIRTRDPVGFWLTYRRIDSAHEVWVAPQVYDRPAPAVAALCGPEASPAPVSTSERSSALVRPYEKGDPLRAISWRQTAHHGRLMSFEMERDERIFPIVAVDTIEVDDADALAAEALSACAHLSRMRGARDEIVLTDGCSRAVGIRRARRLAAALQPDPPADGDAGGEAARRARAIIRAAQTGASAHASRPIVLVASSAASALEQELRRATGAPRLLVVRPRGRAAGSEVDRDASAHTLESPVSARRRRGLQAPRPPLACDIASAILSITVALLSFSLMTTLIEPRTWQAFGVLAAVAVACASILPRGKMGTGTFFPRLALRAAVLAVIVAGGIVLAAHLVRTDFGVDVFSPDADLAALQIDGYGGGLSWAIPVFARGIYNLYFGHWVPVETDALADAALVLAMAPFALALSILLASRRLRPLVVCLPLGLLAVRFVFMGATSDAAHIALTVACGLALRVLACTDSPDDATPRAPRAVAALRALRPQALAACLAIALFADAAAPYATVQAQQLPIDLGCQSNLLAGSTVSPIVDLKRDLTRPQETVAFTYTTTSRQPLYLRLATLGNLDDDTWRLDASETDGLLASLFSGSSRKDRAPALPGAWQKPDPTVEMLRTMNATAAGSLRIIETRVSIEALASRFAPLPLGAFSTATAADEPTGDWRWDEDGSVSGTASLTNRGQAYTVESAYIEPVTNNESLRLVANPLVNEVYSSVLTSTNMSSREEALAAYEELDRTLEEYRAAADERYLQLPDELPAQIQEVAEQAKAVGNLGDPNPLTRELSIIGYLLAYFDDPRFVYSLDAPDGGGADNLSVIAAFLDTGEGYCLHYASSFAVLGRAAGIPARLALGYRAHTQRADGTYVATNHDLHAWTEVYLYGIGWIPIDVTPAQAGTGAGSAGQKTEQPEQTPDTPEQQTTPDSPATPEDPATPNEPETDGAHDADDAPDPLGEALLAARRVLEKAAPVVGAVLLVGAVAAAPRLARKARRAMRLRAIDRADRDRVHAAAAAWAEALTLARAQGLTWPASATEEDIAELIGSASPASAQAARGLADAVCRARYGDPDLLELTPASLRAALDAIEAALKGPNRG